MSGFNRHVNFWTLHTRKSITSIMYVANEKRQIHPKTENLTKYIHFDLVVVNYHQQNQSKNTKNLSTVSRRKLNLLGVVAYSIEMTGN